MIKALKQITCHALLICMPILGFANVKLPALIANNMVLQQSSKITLWGWASPNETLEISCSWQRDKLKLIADNSGQWKTQVRTKKAGGPYTINFKGNNTITIKDVYFGEVWLCSGQSNMEWTVIREKSADSVIKAANNSLIRMFTVTKAASPLLKDNVVGQWTVCSPKTVENFSAVAYHFGNELSIKLGIPIGLIHSSWGGTPAESWVNKETLESEESLKPILSRFEEAIKRYENIKLSVPDKKVSDPRTRFNSPNVLYNTMINPLINYTIKGVIWYQGEANAGRAYQYRKLFPALIQNWRNKFNNTNLPFYYVQIAPYKGQNPEIREAQLLTTKTVKNVGMVVTTDIGNCEDIHPKDKETVGKRLSYIALNKTYGFNKIEYLSPMYKKMKNEGNKIRIYFDSFSELVAKGSLKEFTIAGEDRVFHPAIAKIEGKTIVVSNEKVKDPTAVRFAWANCPVGNLFNKAGLPASPFRTDSFKGITEGKD